MLKSITWSVISEFNCRLGAGVVLATVTYTGERAVRFARKLSLIKHGHPAGAFYEGEVIALARVDKIEFA